MKIGIVDHPQRFMRHKRPHGSNSVTSLAQFNREFINMILPKQGAVKAAFEGRGEVAQPNVFRDMT
jgi:hypothetical protein